MVQLLPDPMDLPQAEPAPCPGSTRVSSPKVMILFLKESYKNPAKSSLVKSDFTARSGRPTSPKNKVSPVKTQYSLPSEVNNKKLEDSGV